MSRKEVQITDKVLARMAGMVVGSLRYYAHEAECDGEIEDYVTPLSTIADHIEEGIATEEEWIEAFDILDVSDWRL
jgi:hypothetical protein